MNPCRAIKFPVNTVFAVSYMLVSSFSFVSKNHLISSLSSSLAHWLFSSEWFYFWVFDLILQFCVWLNFYLKCILVWKNSQYHFYHLDFMEVCFVAQQVVYLGKCPMYMKNVYSVFWRNKKPYSYLLAIFFISSFKASIFLLIFSLVNLSRGDRQCWSLQLLCCFQCPLWSLLAVVLSICWPLIGNIYA